MTDFAVFARWRQRSPAGKPCHLAVFSVDGRFLRNVLCPRYVCGVQVTQLTPNHAHLVGWRHACVVCAEPSAVRCQINGLVDDLIHHVVPWPVLHRTGDRLAGADRIHGALVERTGADLVQDNLVSTVFQCACNRGTAPSGPRSRWDQGRTSKTRLKGVWAARRKRLKPASATTSAILAGPAWAPRARPTSWESEAGVHSRVENP